MNRSADLVEVELLNFPLRIFESAREHHDEMMREFAIIALAPADPNPSTRLVPHRLLELTDVLGREYAAAAERGNEVRDSAIERGEETVDLSVRVPRDSGAQITVMHELMAEADEYCRTEDLLTLPAKAVDLAFREWFLAEFIRQLAGGSPTPWNGPVTEPSN